MEIFKNLKFFEIFEILRPKLHALTDGRTCYTRMIFYFFIFKIHYRKISAAQYKQMSVRAWVLAYKDPQVDHFHSYGLSTVCYFFQYMTFLFCTTHFTVFAVIFTIVTMKENIIILFEFCFACFTPKQFVHLTVLKMFV